MNRVLLVLPLACGLATVTGCADRGYVQREWSATLREYGIVPLFPPREDVFVGDVYAYDYDPESLRTQRLMEKEYWQLTREEKAARMQLGMSPRLCRIDLTREAAEEYRRTPSWPQTTPEYNQILQTSEFSAVTRLIAAQEAAIAKGKNDITAAETAHKAATEQKRLADLEVKAATDDQTRLTATRDDLRAQLASARKALLEEQSKLDAMSPTDAKRPEQQDRVNVATQRVDKLAVQVEEADKAVIAGARRVSDRTKDAADAEAKITKATVDKASAEKAITDAKAAIDKLKEAAATLGAAGTKYLYGQPRDPTYDVYTGEKLPKEILKEGKPDPEAQASDLVNSRENRIRLVAFPDFAATTFTEGQLNALVPVEAFALGVRGNFSDLDSVSVKVPAAESYCVPIDDVRSHLVRPGGPSFAALRSDIALVVRRTVQANPPKGGTATWSKQHIADLGERAGRMLAERLVVDGRPRPTGVSNDTIVAAYCEVIRTLGAAPATPASLATLIDATASALRGMLANPSASMILDNDIHAAAQFQMLRPDSGTNDGKYYYVRVITEVFYARAMDIGLTAKTSFGARAELETVAQLATEDGKAPTPIDLQNPQPGTPVNKDPGVLTASDLVTRTQAQLGERLKVPGGSVQLLSYSERSIGLRRVFDRPVAIGFRGVTLQVDRETGVVQRVQPPSTITPTRYE